MNQDARACISQARRSRRWPLPPPATLAAPPLPPPAASAAHQTPHWRPGPRKPRPSCVRPAAAGAEERAGGGLATRQGGGRRAGSSCWAGQGTEQSSAPRLPRHHTLSSPTFRAHLAHALPAERKHQRHLALARQRRQRRRRALGALLCCCLVAALRPAACCRPRRGLCRRCCCCGCSCCRRSGVLDGGDIGRQQHELSPPRLDRLLHLARVRGAARAAGARGGRRRQWMCSWPAGQGGTTDCHFPPFFADSKRAVKRGGAPRACPTPGAACA